MKVTQQLRWTMRAELVAAPIDRQYQWDFNVTSGVRLSRHCVPLLQQRTTDGSSS
jgi:hypothetical protein